MCLRDRRPDQARNLDWRESRRCWVGWVGIKGGRGLCVSIILEQKKMVVASQFFRVFPFLTTQFFLLVSSVAAFFVNGGRVKIFFHSTTPNDSFLCSSFHISCLQRLNFRHSIKTCRTVCEVWPHSRRSLSTISRLYKNEPSPIFDVLICTSKWLRSFVSLVWIFKPFQSGCETQSRRTLPLTSCWRWAVRIAAMGGDPDPVSCFIRICFSLYRNTRLFIDFIDDTMSKSMTFLPSLVGH